MKAKPFEQGQVLGGYRVDGLKYLGETIDDTTYDCTTICCGKEAVKTHVILFDARKRGQKACKPCADRAYQESRKDSSRRQVGEILGFYEVLEVVGDGYRATPRSRKPVTRAWPAAVHAGTRGSSARRRKRSQ